ncbi:MAG: fimbrillin family protein [Paramuribaculum sp.]|nr:fimbrillin family protein [Paramuribaculum sp.]
MITAQDQGDPIGFTTSVNTHSRTSLIHTTENLDSFRIYAYCPDGLEFFKDLLVTKVDPDSIEANYYALHWSIEGGPYFYPRDAAWVDYYAYRFISGIDGHYSRNSFLPHSSTPEEGRRIDINAAKQMIHDFRPYQRPQDQEDLIIEHKRSYNDEVSGVELHFHHALSQIELKAYSPNNNTRVYVAGAWFCNIINNGDVTFPQPKVSGIGDDQLYWTLPGRQNYDDATVVDPDQLLKGSNRSHYGWFFPEPVMLGFSINEPTSLPVIPDEGDDNEGDNEDETTRARSRADGDETTPGIPDDENWPDPAPPGEGHHTDYNNDGVCDHLVTENMTASRYISHLLTNKNTEHDGMDATNMLLLPQQLVPYNKNREEDPKQQFYDEEGKPNNHGAYILLAIQVWMIHGDENHMHRHILFPYTDPEKWNINGLPVNADGIPWDNIGNRLDDKGFPVNNETGEPMYSDPDQTQRIDNFGNLVGDDGVIYDKNTGKPIDNYGYRYPDVNYSVGWKEVRKQFAWVCVPIDDKWEPGYKYTYILEFMGPKSGAGIYPPDDFDFGMGGVGIDGEISTACRDNWKALPGQDYADRYEIIPSQQCRLRDPGTMNSKKKWVGKKQGDPVLSKAIDFRVVVDEWNNRDIPVDMEDYLTPPPSSSDSGNKKSK